MAFRKRNVPLSRTEQKPGSPSVPASTEPSSAEVPQAITGVRPSPLDGRPTTSTGTPSLDAILAGHAGLPLGNSIFIGEQGTTDYAGALLRFYAAEGVVQGHRVHVVGMGEAWGRELPGLSEKDESGRKIKTSAEEEKMKIAWRYESLSVHGAERGERFKHAGTSLSGKTGEDQAIFCHTFDLAKRLMLPVGTAINYIPIAPQRNPFPSILQNLQNDLASTPPNTIHRLVIPSLLSPAIYPPISTRPDCVLQFLHGLRALLRLHPTQLTAIITFPLTLYPRSTGLVRWMEILSDGVMELSPFPYDYAQVLSAATKEEDKPQGIFAVHKLPVYSEKGGGGNVEGLGEDLAFTLSRRKFTVTKFSLPPAEGDTEAQEEAARGSGATPMPKKEDLDF
ncbi:paxneb superfamily protein-like protein [Westerdykella ornata]|uniref:Elongator complex protein 4 n=1 Tax=Westerdykella ornata TaxID=318751 RepID=A0A6A6JBG3_WESOR|nr:paxneb superfamily protein-like protein [Westerdykella ornata]KAF2272976.1 paxneb superfamily protein-like protein [Westerdykella ornata]